MEGRAVGYNFEMRSHEYHPRKIWSSCFIRVLISIISINRRKEKFHRKTFIFILFAIKYQWAIKETSIFCNSSHLEWRVNTCKGPIQAKFSLIWFRGKYLNVKVYAGRTPSDGKSSHSPWPDQPKNDFSHNLVSATLG